MRVEGEEEERGGGGEEGGASAKCQSTAKQTWRMWESHSMPPHLAQVGEVSLSEVHRFFIESNEA